MSLTVAAPLAGTVVALEDVPDPVFAGKFVGPGIAIDPERGDDVTALAPISGTIAKIHPHAFVVVGDNGRAILTHLGLDTVQLAGEGFTVHVHEGDTVTAGDPMVTWSPRSIETGGLNPIVPIVALEGEETALVLPHAGVQVTAGAELMTWN